MKRIVEVWFIAFALATAMIVGIWLVDQMLNVDNNIEYQTR